MRFLAHAVLLAGLIFLAAANAAVDTGKAEGPSVHARPSVILPPGTDPGLGFLEAADINGGVIHLGISFYMPTVLDRDGNSIRAEDRVCVGDTISFVGEMNAEFFVEGASFDSPPVQFVPSLQEVIGQIGRGTYKTRVYNTPVCTVVTRDCIDGAVICEAGCSLDSDLKQAGYGLGEGSAAGSTFVVEEQGAHKIDFTCKPKCILFADKTIVYSGGGQLIAYGYMNLSDSGNKAASIHPVQASYAFEAANPIGPRIQATSFIDEVDGKSLARFEVANIGDTAAAIERVGMKNADYKVLYAPRIVGAGSKEDVIVEFARKGDQSVDLDLDYESVSLGCLKERDGSLTSLIIQGTQAECKNDFECSKQSVCCTGLCRDPSKGVCEDINGDGKQDTWVPN